MSKILSSLIIFLQLEQRHRLILIILLILLIILSILLNDNLLLMPPPLPRLDRLLHQVHIHQPFPIHIKSQDVHTLLTWFLKHLFKLALRDRVILSLELELVVLLLHGPPHVIGFRFLVLEEEVWFGETCEGASFFNWCSERILLQKLRIIISIRRQKFIIRSFYLWQHD